MNDFSLGALRLVGSYLPAESKEQKKKTFLTNIFNKQYIF